MSFRLSPVSGPPIPPAEAAGKVRARGTHRAFTDSLTVATAACAMASAVLLVEPDEGVRPAWLAAVTAGTAPVAIEEAPRYRIDGVSTAQNRVVVTVAHEGGVPRGDLEVSVNGGIRRVFHGGTGSLVLPLEDAVQRPTAVTVDVRTADGRSGRSLSAFLAPDAPNDIALASVRLDDGWLIATITSNSPIPLAGEVIVAARDHGFPYTLRGRASVPLNIDAWGQQEVRVGHVGAINLDTTWIGLTTDAIDDADIGNNELQPMPVPPRGPH